MWSVYKWLSKKQQRSFANSSIWQKWLGKNFHHFFTFIKYQKNAKKNNDDLDNDTHEIEVREETARKHSTI